MAATNRLLLNSVRPASTSTEKLAVAWESSGVLAASTVIKAKPGLLGAVMVQTTDNGTDQVLKVWDSPDATMTDDVILYQCELPEATDGARQYVKFPMPGIQAHLGIYIEIAGDLEYEIIYR